MPASIGYLIDTDILIDLLRGKQGARRLLTSRLAPWAVSQVTALELIVGARDKREMALIDQFLTNCTIIPLRGSTGLTAYELLKNYAKSNGLQVFDSLIAATAIGEGLTLASRNRKHFAMIDQLTLEVPEY